jgi:hypothetical protein
LCKRSIDSSEAIAASHVSLSAGASLDQGGQKCIELRPAAQVWQCTACYMALPIRSCTPLRCVGIPCAL